LTTASAASFVDPYKTEAILKEEEEEGGGGGRGDV
jgi:hypothetical protein